MICVCVSAGVRLKLSQEAIAAAQVFYLTFVSVMDQDEFESTVSRVSWGGGGTLGFPPPPPPPPGEVSPPQKTEDNNIINLILNWLDMQQYKQWRIFLFSSLLTCCRYVATPGLAFSARNIVHCLKPNCLGTRPRSSIPLCVRTYYVCE